MTLKLAQPLHSLTMLACTQVMGNTFLHQQEQPDTKVQLSSSLVSLAPCLPGQATYQTLMLMNHGDTAVQFDMQGLAQSPGLSCKPERSARKVSLQRTRLPHHALSKLLLSTSHLFQTVLRLLPECKSMACGWSGLTVTWSLPRLASAYLSPPVMLAPALRHLL